MKLFIALLCCVVMGLAMDGAYHKGYQDGESHQRALSSGVSIDYCPFQPPQPCSTLPKLAKE